jgi:ferritin
MTGLSEYLLEKQLSKIHSKWHPKEGLFTSDNPQEIASYLLSHSKDRAQAMQRLVFYMNRAGENLTNKAVLDKAKKILEKD